MDSLQIPKYFLCANTPKGFISRLNLLTDISKYKEVYILNGVSGGEKSKIIKSAVEKSQAKHKEIICSVQDEDGLDAAVLDDVAIINAGIPSTIIPRYPQVFEKIIDFNCCCNPAALEPFKYEIMKLFDEQNHEYQQAQFNLHHAQSLLGDVCQTVINKSDIAALEYNMERLCKKYIPQIGEGAVETKRMISVFSKSGQTTLQNTLDIMTSTQIVISDEYNALENFAICCIRDYCLRKEWAVISLYDPMSPYFKLEGIIVPQLELGFGRKEIASAGSEEILLSPYYSNDLLTSFNRLNNQIAAAKNFRQKAKEALIKFDTIRLQIQALYFPAVDLAYAQQLGQQFIERIT